MSTAIKLRGDTLANWTVNNPILLERETVVETDTKRFKIGTGDRYLSTDYTDKAITELIESKAPTANPTFTGTVIIPAATNAFCAVQQGTLDDRVPTSPGSNYYLISNDDGTNIWTQNVALKDNPTFTGVQTFADNDEAAALATGTVYKTLTGVLMIKY